MANKTVTVKPSGGTYTTLQGAITGELAANANLVTMEGILTISIEGDWSGGADTAAATINGFTMNASYYLRVVANAANQAVKTGWDTSRYILQGTDVDALTISDDYVRIEGLQIQFVYSSSAQSCVRIVSISATNNDIRFIGCRMDSTGGQACIEASDTDLILKLFNCIFTGADGARMTVASALIYHCIAYGCSSDGFELDAGIATALNCVSFGNGDDFSDDVGGGAFTIDYCASDDDDQTGGHNIAESGGGATWPSDFADAAAGNFTLLVGSNLKGAGTALGDGPTTDIDGDAWASPPSLGADEYAAAGGSIVPLLMQQYRRRRG